MTCFMLVSLSIVISCKGQPKSNQASTIATGMNTNNGKIYSDSIYGKIVKCLLRDKSGNIWIGTTWNGIFRYDGKTFTHFTEAEGLCSNIVNTTQEDKDGLIWVGTNNGECRFKGNGFIGFSLETISNGVSNNQV